MTEQEAIEVLRDFDKQVHAKADGSYQSTIGEMACEVAIKAIEEVQQYQAIGTVEKVREYKEIADNMNAVSMAKLCVSLYKLEKYERVGTPEEFQVAVEKQKAKKPIIVNEGTMLNFKCPRCGIERIVGRNAREDYCGECGQSWDWSDEE